MLPWWDERGVEPLKPLNPYARVEAETMAWTSRIQRDRDRPFRWVPGLKTARSDKVGMYVTRVTDLNYLKVNRVDFGSGGAKRFTANVASETGGGTIELRLGSLDGRHLGSLTVSKTGGWDEWQRQSVPVSGATGTHDLYLVFRGNGDAPLLNFDHWTFSR